MNLYNFVAEFHQGKAGGYRDKEYDESKHKRGRNTPDKNGVVNPGQFGSGGSKTEASEESTLPEAQPPEPVGPSGLTDTQLQDLDDVLEVEEAFQEEIQEVTTAEDSTEEFQELQLDEKDFERPGYNELDDAGKADYQRLVAAHRDCEKIFQESGQEDQWDEFIDSTHKYTWLGFSSVTKKLLGKSIFSGEEKDANKIIQDFDRVFEKIPDLPKPVTVHRGIKLENDVVKDFVSRLESGIIEIPNFQSTSLLQSKAEPFARAKGDYTNMRFEIKARKGIFLEPISKFSEELEFLLPRGAKFKVGEKRMDGEVTVYQLEQL